MADERMTPTKATALMARAADAPSGRWLDGRLISAVLVLAATGLVMVASASIAMAERFGSPLVLFQRQMVYLAIASVAGVAVVSIPLAKWQSASRMLLIFAYFLLLVVLVPGVGHEVNGATRWLDFGLFQLQVSELARPALIIYLAGYIARRSALVRDDARGFWVPTGAVAGASLLMVASPDFGGAAVLLATGVVMLFLAGASLTRLLALGSGLLAVGTTMVLNAPYRVERMTAFINPWSDPLDSGFQLTQALIAIGRGGWFGVGLGDSVQKLFYLPEAHTDFLFAVLAEELGLIGVIAVLALYTYLVYRVFRIGAASHAVGHAFGGYLAWGIAAWLGLQCFVNVGVNLGVLPTKGLTLPLMSYGGSSLVTTVAVLALVLRVDHETRGARATGGDHGG